MDGWIRILYIIMMNAWTCIFMLAMTQNRVLINFFPIIFLHTHIDISNFPIYRINTLHLNWDFLGENYFTIRGKMRVWHFFYKLKTILLRGLFFHVKCRGAASAATSSGDGGGSLSCLMCEVLCVGKGFWI